MLKDKNKFFICTFFLFIFLFSACGIESTQTESTSNKEAASLTKDLLIDNLYYAETKNIEGYLSTIPSKAHEDTRQAMEDFFAKYTVSHRLLEFEVLEASENEIIAKTKQETIGQNDIGDEEYKNHIAEGLHIFQKIDTEWKITESSITDLTFIE